MIDALIKCLDKCFGALVEIPVNSCCRQHRSSAVKKRRCRANYDASTNKESNLCNQNAK